MGSHVQAKNYCMKEDTRLEGPWEFGTEPASDGRKDISSLQDLKDALDQGMSLKDISQNYFGMWLRHHRAMQVYLHLNGSRRTWVPEVIVLVGPSGVGKTKYASELAPDAYFKERGSWWDGYEGQQDVIIDEFYGWIRYSVLLRLLDRTPMSVEIKGSFTPFLAKRIFITSNAFINQWYKYSENHFNIDALRRRVTLYLTKSSFESEWQDALPLEPVIPVVKCI